MHVQRKFWKPHGKTSLCWGFYCVNDNANAQIMCCIFCDKKLVIVTNLRTQVRNSLFFITKKWNNFFLKTYGCRSYAYCKEIWK
jgi:hypothetical protein